MLDVNRLRALLHVVESGSVTTAANELHHTPSAISQQLRKLEADVRQPLISRVNGRMVPTDAGVALSAHARTVFRVLDAARADLDRLANLESGSVKIGTFPTLGSSFLPPVIDQFRREYPSLSIEVRSTRLNDLLDRLARGDVGLCFLWDYAWNRLDSQEFDLSVVFEEPTVLLVGAEHRLAGKKTVRLADLAAEQWIIRADRHPVSEVLERSCHAAGFAPKIAFQANDYLEAQAMASVGLGIALAPETAVVTRHPGVRVLGLGDDAPRRRVVLGQRRDRVRAPAEVALQSLILRLGEAWATGPARSGLFLV